MDKYDFIVATIVLVLVLTVLFTVLTYVMRIYYWLKGARLEKNKTELEQYLVGRIINADLEQELSLEAN